MAAWLSLRGESGDRWWWHVTCLPPARRLLVVGVSVLCSELTRQIFDVSESVLLFVTSSEAIELLVSEEFFVHLLALSLWVRPLLQVFAAVLVEVAAFEAVSLARLFYVRLLMRGFSCKSLLLVLLLSAVSELLGTSLAVLAVLCGLASLTLLLLPVERLLELVPVLLWLHVRGVSDTFAFVCWRVVWKRWWEGKPCSTGASCWVGAMWSVDHAPGNGLLLLVVGLLLRGL